MKRIDFKKVMAWLGFMLRCPICGYKYNLSNIKVIESTEDEAAEEARILIHSDCERCKSSVIFNIDINGPEVLTAGMVTDLTSSDSTKFSQRQALDVDEVIQIHKSLKAFDGDIIRALKKQ